MKLLLASIITVVLLTVGASNVYAVTETFEFYVDGDGDRIKISGKVQPATDIFVTIWNNSGEMLIDTESKVVETDAGSFEYRFDKSHLSGYGHYTGEISDGRFTQGFEFSLNSSDVAPLKQMKSGILQHDVVCKYDFVKMQKASPDGEQIPVCVKLQSSEKIQQRGWAIA